MKKKFGVSSAVEKSVSSNRQKKKTTYFYIGNKKRTLVNLVTTMNAQRYERCQCTQGDSAELTVYIPCVLASACVRVYSRIYGARMVIKKSSPPARGQ